MEERQDNAIYKLVVNHEEQYSIWPVDRENPLGWGDTGTSEPKACVAYIKEVWTTCDRSACGKDGINNEENIAA